MFSAPRTIVPPICALSDDFLPRAGLSPHFINPICVSGMVSFCGWPDLDIDECLSLDFLSFDSVFPWLFSDSSAPPGSLHVSRGNLNTRAARHHSTEIAILSLFSQHGRPFDLQCNPVRLFHCAHARCSHGRAQAQYLRRNA